ncbi:hypothetical protein Tco_1449407 [Tanacetum coccineum]
MSLIELSQVTIPFPGHLKEYGYDKIEVMKELEKLQVDSTKSTTCLRRFLKEKSRIEEEIKATIDTHCFAILEDALPPKEKDLGSFTLPCIINNMCFEKALVDLGASVSDYSTFTNVCIGYEHVNANFFLILSINVMSKRFYNSIIKDEVEYKGENAVGAFMNVPIFVGNFSIVTDSVVVENIDAYRDKYTGHVIVGKPFCRYAYVKARRFDGFITIGDGTDSVTYQMARSHPRFKHLSNEQCNKIRPLLKVSAHD